MLQIKKKRIENLMGGKWLAPFKLFLRKLNHSKRTEKMKNAFAATYTEPTPLFHQIQIETCSFCNNDCHFCPASTAVDPRPKKFMDWEILKELSEQLKNIDFNGLISLFNNNDPLIDKRLPEIIRHFKKELPNAKIEIYTNGILLNMEIAVALWDAGLDSLMVDHYYTKTKRNKNIEKFIDDYKKSEYALEHSVTINEINKEIIRSSRGGEAPNKKSGSAGGFCAYPFMQFNVNYKGDVHLCCNDVYYKEVFGNITEQTIENIWNSPRYQVIRKRMLKDDRNFGICKGCDTIPVFKGAKDLVHQQKNNQLVIPSYINNGNKVNYREPAKIYPMS
jgi:radical SAM protein with 4Fe4S-binding SPASM domain